MPKVGGHVSSAISLNLAFERAQKIGADCFQFFISPPQQWLQTEHSEDEISKFRQLEESTGIRPNFIHGTYLINLGTEKPEHLQKSIYWLIYGINMASKLGSQGIIFHIGSHKGKGFDTVIDQVVDSIKKVLDGSSRFANAHSNNKYTSSSNEVEKLPYLILETSAGGGGTIGRDFNELGKILNQVQDDRLKVCLDTQHVFAAGYDVKNLIGLNDVLEEFDEEIGLSNLAVIHANDSKTEIKSYRDRHENIGEGIIGLEGFTNLINNPQLQNVPFILEVPGFTGTGPDLENVKLLKSLISK